MLVLGWKERAFIENVNSRCFCCFPAAILVDQNVTFVAWQWNGCQWRWALDLNDLTGKKTDCEQSINVTIDCNWLLITLTKGSCNKAVNSLGSVGSAGLAGSAVYSLQFRRFSTRYFGICQFFLQYWGIGYPPMSPSFREELKSRDSQVLIP